MPADTCGERLQDECGCDFPVVDAESTQGRAYVDTRTTFLARCPTACIGLVCNPVPNAECFSENGNLTAGQCVARPN
jgi:hypothetical protein